MRPKAVATAAAVLATLAAPAAASAASITASPVKQCYRAGESVTLGGSGYTPSSSVQVKSDGANAGVANTDGTGAFSGKLHLYALTSGERLKTYSATDTSNTANTASLQLRVSRLNVSVKPRHGKPGRLLTIGARGFTTGKTLYAHVVRGRHYRRNLRIGRLKGACRKLSVRKRVFSGRTRTGTYTVQFDTRRHYSSKTAVRYRFSVPVYRTFSSSHAAAAQSWTRG